MDAGRYNIPPQTQPRWDDNSVWHIQKSDVVSSLLIYRMLMPLVSMFNGSYMILHIYIYPSHIWQKQETKARVMDMAFYTHVRHAHILLTTPYSFGCTGGIGEL